MPYGLNLFDVLTNLLLDLTLFKPTLFKTVLDIPVSVANWTFSFQLFATVAQILFDPTLPTTTLPELSLESDSSALDICATSDCFFSVVRQTLAKWFGF